MKPSVRTKLRLIIGSSSLALLLMVAISLTFLAAQLGNLADIERRRSGDRRWLAARGGSVRRRA